MTEPLLCPLMDFTNRHNKYLNILSKMAVAVEPVAAARIAAGLVYKNEFISFGICQRKTHPFQAQYGKNSNSIYLHAETDCIKNALKLVGLDIISKSTLYICRVKFEDETKRKFIFGLAKPCPGCARAIATFNIRNVVYSLDHGEYGIL